MTGSLNYLQLADWRRRTALLYSDVRAAPEAGLQIAWDEWRAARNDLLRNHEQSPLTESQRADFRALDYFPYDPGWRILADIDPDAGGHRIHFELGSDGDFTIVRIGWVNFATGQISARLALYWIEGYGGGLFLPFKDATNHRSGREAGSTYTGGRYLYDTIKGADLGMDGSQLVLDFNYAYNPSCAYHPRWVCPLAPDENRFLFPVTAGEKRLALTERPA